MRHAPFSEKAAREAVANAICWADALRALGYRPVGHNFRTRQRHARRWGISTGHFDPNQARRRASINRSRPLTELLVANSSYNRGTLKKRLFAEGLKQRRCELCGQGEIWRGRRMSLILDHVNGIGTDNRIENLQIVCPNCAATLDTHCGRNLPRERRCAACEAAFAPRTIQQRYCTLACFNRVRQVSDELSRRGVPQLDRRRVERPPLADLLTEIEQFGYCAVGRMYHVSDNAIRKWVRQYEREAATRGAAQG